MTDAKRSHGTRNLATGIACSAILLAGLTVGSHSKDPDKTVLAEPTSPSTNRSATGSLAIAASSPALSYPKKLTAAGGPTVWFLAHRIHGTSRIACLARASLENVCRTADDV